MADRERPFSFGEEILAPKSDDPADRKFLIKHAQALEEVADPRGISPLIATNQEIADMRAEIRGVTSGGEAALTAPEKRAREEFRLARRPQFVERVEQAWYADRGHHPVELFAQMNDQDLEYFEDPEIAEFLADDIVLAGTAALSSRRMERHIEDIATRIYEQEVNQNNWIDDVLEGIFLPAFLRERGVGVEERITAEEAARQAREQGFSISPEEVGEGPGQIPMRDLSPEQLSDLRTQIRGGGILPDKPFTREAYQKAVEIAAGREVMDAEGVAEIFQTAHEMIGPEIVQDFQEFLGLGLKGPMSAIGALEKGVMFQGREALATFLGPEASKELLDYTIQSPELQERREQLGKARTGESRDEYIRQAQTGAAPFLVWQDMQESAPEEFEEYVEMWGGDVEIARMAFFIEFQDHAQHPDVQEQLEDLVEFGVYRPAEAQIDALEEQHFMDGSLILDMVMTGGKFVDSIGAGVIEATQGLITDEDRREMAREMRVGDFLSSVAQEVELGHQTPAGVLGIEGTGAGFLANVGAGIIFDPLNLMFLPGMRGARHALGSTQGIDMVMNSPAMRMWVRDLGGILSQRGAKGANVLYHLSEVGMSGRALVKSGLADPVLTDNLWLNTRHGRLAQPTDTTRVTDLLDDVQRSQLDELDAAKVEQAQNELLNANSFKEPLILEYDDVAGRLKVPLEGDELATLKAAQELGVEKIPVVVRYGKSADELAPVLTWKGAPEVASRPEDFVYHGTARGAPSEMTQGGLTGSLERAQEYAAGVKVVGKDGQEVIFLRDDLPKLRPGDDVQALLMEKAQEYMAKNRIEGRIEPLPGEVVAVSRDQLPHSLNAQLDKGLDIEDIAEFGGDQGTLRLEPAAVATFERPPSLTGPAGRSLDELGVKSPAKIDAHDVNGTDFFSPTQIFTPEQLGQIADIPGLTEVVRHALLRGAQLPGATQAWGAVGLGAIFRRAAQSRPGKWLDPYVRTSFNVNTIPSSGSGGLRRGLELVQFLNRNDEWSRAWSQRIVRNEQALGRAQVAVAENQAKLAAWKSLDSRLANRQMHDAPETARQALVEEAADLGIDDLTIDRMATIDEIRNQVRAQIREVQNDLVTSMKSKHGAQDWQELYSELLDEYNREFIATNPEWAEFVDPETGLVPWENIHRGFDLSEIGVPEFTPGAGRQERLAAEVARNRERAAIYNELGERIDADVALEMFTGHSGVVDDIKLPATPIELAAATERGGAAYTKLTQEMMGATIRYGGHFFDQIWKANVLLSPRTMMVMSVDELTSLMHAGGFDFVQRYLVARGEKIAARFKGTSLDYRRGTGELSAKSAENLRGLQDISDEFKSYASQLAEGVSREQMTLQPGSLGYRQAAARYGRDFVENPAFRRYLEGEDAFRDWFNSPEGQEWSLSQTIKYTDENGAVQYRPIRGWREGFEMADGAWRYLEQTALRNGLEDAGAFRQAFEDTAAKVEIEHTGRAVHLPEWTYDHFGPLRGYKPVYPGSSALWPTIGRAFEMGAANPAAFRQGLAADMMRQTEKARLRSLFESQGLEIVPDAELLGILKTRGLNVGEINQFSAPWIDDALAKQGIITEGYIGRLAENRARDFVNDMTYSFEQGSRFGRESAAVFPFGRAWGDMFGRWGRMLGSRAIVRPWMNRIGIGPAVQKLADHFPLNPKVAMFISKVAARSMEITGGLFGERETDLDFSPITFLPNVDGGVSNLIPGLGILPVGVVDQALDLFGPDPVDEPQAYNQMIQTIGQYIPGVQLHGRGLTQRFTGGGLTGVASNLITELVRANPLSDPNRQAWQYTGNIRAELVASRSVGAVLSDPDVLNDILNADDPDMVAALITGALRSADLEAAKLNATDAALGWIIPARGALDTNLDELYGVWTGTARDFSEFFPDLDIPDDETLKGDPELLLKLGDDVRRRFFALPGWQRDLLVAAHPQLAVNLISTWEWSESAPNDLPGIDMPYRTTTSAPDTRSLQEALDRHNNYVRHGWVVPRNPNTKPHEIIGTALEARDRITREMYEITAAKTNDFLWDNLVSEETKAKMEFALSQVSDLQEIGISDPRKLWEKWGSERRTVLDHLFEVTGVEQVNPDYLTAVELALDALSPEEAFTVLHLDAIEDQAGIPKTTPEQKDQIEELLAVVRVPEAEEAWSTEWRGETVEGFSQRFRESPVLLPKEAGQIADTLGIDIPENATGEDFLNAIMQYRSTLKSAAWDEARLHYSGYVEQRGAAHAAGMDTLRDVATNQRLDENFREQVDGYMKWLDNQLDDNEGDLPRHVQDEAVDRFNRLRTSGRDAPINWERVWHRAFQPRFGALEWEPPEPASPENGENPNSWAPFVRYVVDGDTIVVSENRGPSLIGGGLLPRVETDTGETRGHEVRLLGVYAADYYEDENAADEQRDRLESALLEARRNGDQIWLVRDPDYAGSHVDPFGRELAWLWIGDEPFYFPDELRRGQ